MVGKVTGIDVQFNSHLENMFYENSISQPENVLIGLNSKNISKSEIG